MTIASVWIWNTEQNWRCSLPHIKQVWVQCAFKRMFAWLSIFLNTPFHLTILPDTKRYHRMSAMLHPLGWLPSPTFHGTSGSTPLVKSPAPAFLGPRIPSTQPTSIQTWSMKRLNIIQAHFLVSHHPVGKATCESIRGSKCNSCHGPWHHT